MYSHLTGWAANAAILSVADGPSLVGANWTVVGNPTNDPTTFNSQSTFVLPYTHPDGHVTYIYAGDRYDSVTPALFLGELSSVCAW